MMVTIHEDLGLYRMGPVQGFRDGETIDLGEHKLRFLETPHVHHWDSMMVFEETTASLFPADLYLVTFGQSWSRAA